MGKRVNRRTLGRPAPGRVYALTGGPGARCIANGNTWAESEVSDPYGAAPVALDWQTSAEHRGLQGTAFPECATRPEQGALL